ncbi:sodium:solute symporter family protein [Thermosediminibacter oceani]|uniref:Na+/solute symporter n=1 Tax=Thermosediminibacter oceani (strain ATCC BAA-1034 / DSM 16646 / JW/IW-1228P) TaxID=555079 RepID=D9RY02_THEOJ|nr:sodium:solute symporter family protein [Thermosediminibacter oceani]ADL08226.1 Na+/solute symporter [Thermosediminibacter oceani DSM 16646]
MILFILVLYMACMLFVGWWCGKYYIKGMTDFLLAGRRLGPWLLTATLVATHFGGGAVMGGGEYGYNYGLSGAWYGISCGVGLLFLFFTSKFRDLAIYTVPDYLEHRYGGKAVRVLGALLSLVALIGILAAQTIATQSALSIVGIKGDAGAVLATIVFIVYTMVGGLWADTLTDFIQIIIAAIGVVWATMIVLSKAGGMAGLSSLVADKGVTDQYFNIWGMGFSSIMWILIPTVMYTLIGQDFYQRLFSARDSKVAKIGSLAGGIVMIILSLFPAIIGMGARALSDIDDASSAVPWVLQNLMNPVVGGIFLAAILAAIMSTASSLLTAATAHIVKDLWVETFHVDEAKEEKRLLAVSRNFTFILGILSLIIALKVPGIIDALIYSYTMYTAGVFIPVMGGLLWKGATRAGALSSIIAGSIIALAGILTKIKDKYFGAPVEVYAALISLVIFVIVSLATQPKKVDEPAK